MLLGTQTLTAGYKAGGRCVVDVFYLVVWDEARKAWLEVDEVEADSPAHAARLFRAIQPVVVHHNLCRVVDHKQLVALYEGKECVEDLVLA